MKKLNRALWIAVFLIPGAGWASAQAAEVIGFYGDGPIKTYILDNETFIEGPRVNRSDFDSATEIVEQRAGYVNIRSHGRSYWFKDLSVRIRGTRKSPITPFCDKLATQSPLNVQSGTMGAGGTKCVSR